MFHIEYKTYISEMIGNIKCSVGSLFKYREWVSIICIIFVEKLLHHKYFVNLNKQYVRKSSKRK
jgi:hypothetical protein